MTQSDLSLYLRNFYSARDVCESYPSILLLRCDYSEDADKLLLTKFLIDTEVKLYDQTAARKPKTVLLLVHVKTELYDDDRLEGVGVYFSRDWENMHVDDLYQSESEWGRMRSILLENNISIRDFVEADDAAFSMYIQSDILSCFRTINYKYAIDTERVKNLCSEIPIKMQALLKKKVLKYLEEEQKGDTYWVLRIACTRENLEFAASSLSTALTAYCQKRVRNVLCKIVYVLEKYSVLDTFLSLEKITDFEYNLFMYSSKLSLLDIADPRGNECYDVVVVIENLQFPSRRWFSRP